MRARTPAAPDTLHVTFVSDAAPIDDSLRVGVTAQEDRLQADCVTSGTVFVDLFGAFRGTVQIRVSGVAEVQVQTTGFQPVRAPLGEISALHCMLTDEGWSCI